MFVMLLIIAREALILVVMLNVQLANTGTAALVWVVIVLVGPILVVVPVRVRRLIVMEQPILAVVLQFINTLQVMVKSGMAALGRQLVLRSIVVPQVILFAPLRLHLLIVRAVIPMALVV